ncbi:hypothetical protein An12g07980 [Aspergillus niger]|uniref:Uncharacterized protein n=2 Tax=Aspergillus niger TaxID=5061 RepID=A2R0B0_ASPNC|nr:hypothetical protein An12g07980 [Aspergillus niger]CAK41248.1 hypothetical protein An12g07980 [Aspergillus niger]
MRAIRQPTTFLSRFLQDPGYVRLRLLPSTYHNCPSRSIREYGGCADAQRLKLLAASILLSQQIQSRNVSPAYEVFGYCNYYHVYSEVLPYDYCDPGQSDKESVHYCPQPPHLEILTGNSHSAFPRLYAGSVSFNLASMILAQWRRSNQAHREHYCTVHGTVKWAPDGPIIVRSHAKASKGLSISEYPDCSVYGWSPSDLAPFSVGPLEMAAILVVMPLLRALPLEPACYSPVHLWEVSFCGDRLWCVTFSARLNTSNMGNMCESVRRGDKGILIFVDVPKAKSTDRILLVIRILRAYRFVNVMVMSISVEAPQDIKGRDDRRSLHDARPLDEQDFRHGIC